MKIAILFLAALVAAVAAGGEYGNRARESYVNSVNAARQARVNDIAEKVGASSGTYRKDGVPGAYGYNGYYAAAPYYDGAYYGGYDGAYAYPGYAYAGVY